MMGKFRLNLQPIIAVLVIGLFIQDKLTAQSQGPNDPGIVFEQSAACLACPGSDWLNPMNASISDNAFATSSLNTYPNCFQSACYFSRGLQATNYGFTIPANATITGIKVDIQKKALTAGTLTDTIVQLVSNSLGVGNNYGMTGYWATTNTTYTYGGTTDLWGYIWTPALINAANFGVFLKLKNISNLQQNASVDHFGITVYYSIPTSVAEINFSDDNIMNVQYDTYQQSIILSGTLAGSADYSISVYDITGKQVIITQNVNLAKGDFKQALHTNSLNTGLYFISVNSGDKKIVKKFIVTNK